MGRNAGGVNAGALDGGTLGKGNTERGYTQEMVKNIVGNEDKIKGNKTESAYIYDENGNLVREVTGGKKREITIGAAKKNSIVSHNHPTERGEENDLLTFSYQDLQYAVHYNLKEIRAVSKKYTFSMKRPGNGWGEKAERESIEKRYKRFETEIVKKNRGKVRKLVDQKKYKEAKQLQTKLDEKVLHQAVTKTAKYFGWNYTVKKNK